MSGFNPRTHWMLGEEEATRAKVGGTGSAQTLGMSDEDRERAKDKPPLGFHTEHPGAPPQPGEDCPTCGQRVKHEKKERTPQTNKKAYWVPVDEFKAHEDVLETAAKHLGCYDQPYYEFKTVTLALGLVLQDDRLRGFAHRSWVPPDTETVGLA